MEEETMAVLGQDAHYFLRSAHVRAINRVIKKNRMGLVKGLSWDYSFAKRDLEFAKEAMRKRFNIFKWLDRRHLENAQSEFDDVVDKVHAAGLTIEGEE